MMQKPTMIDSPSGGAPEKAPRWDLMGTEGCGGGNRVSWCSWMFLGCVDIYRRRKSVRDATRGPRGRGAPLGCALHPPGRLGCFLTSTPSLLDCVCSRNNSPEGFIPFGFRLIFLFCETLKYAKKNSNLGWASGYQVSPKNDIKVYIKAHKHPKQVIQSHGTIKNYRYVGDVSSIPKLNSCSSSSR